MRLTRFALCLTLVWAAGAFAPAEAARKTPSTRTSGMTTTAGAQSTTVSIPSGSTWAVIMFTYANVNGAPSSVTLDGQSAVKLASSEAGGNAEIAIYKVAGFSTGASKTLAWTNPSGIHPINGGIEYRDGTPTYGASDSDFGGTGTLTSSALANTSGDEILCAYGSAASVTAIGTGQSKLDETSGTQQFYGFTTETGAGGTDVQSFTAADQHAFACVVVSTATATGAFDTTPFVTGQTSTAYTVGGSLSASGTVNAVACYAGESAPTKAQVIASHCSAGETAKATATQSPSLTPFDFSLTLTPSDSPAFPMYDIYATDGTTLVTMTNQCLNAPANKQFINCPGGLTSIASGGAVDLLNAIITPDWAIGDVPVCDIYTHTIPSGTQQFVFHLSVAGYASYDAGTGDRTYANCDAYDLSAHQYHTSNSANNDLDWWDQDPNIGCMAAFNWVLKLNIPANSSPNPGNLDFSSICSHPLADTLTSALTSGTWPTGITLTSNVASGTPTVENESGAALQVTMTNPLTGSTRIESFTAYPLATLTLTNCLSPLILGTACSNALLAQFHGAILVSTTYDYSTTVAAGYVISQSPAGGTEAAPYSTVSLLVSLGHLPGNATVPNCLSKTYTQCVSLVAASSSFATLSSACAANDKVYSQSPAGNTKALDSYVLTALCR